MGDADSRVNSKSSSPQYSLGAAMLSVAEANSIFQKRLALSKLDHPFTIDSESGELRSSHALAEYNQNHFIMNISAMEETVSRPANLALPAVHSAAENKQSRANTTLHVWIFDPSSQLLLIVLDRAKEQVGHELMARLTGNLSVLLGKEVAVGRVRHHLADGGRIDREK